MLALRINSRWRAVNSPSEICIGNWSFGPVIFAYQQANRRLKKCYPPSQSFSLGSHLIIFSLFVAKFIRRSERNCILHHSHRTKNYEPSQVTYKTWHYKNKEFKPYRMRYSFHIFWIEYLVRVEGTSLLFFQKIHVDFVSPTKAGVKLNTTWNSRQVTRGIYYPYSILRTIHIFMLMRTARAFVFWDLVFIVKIHLTPSHSAPITLTCQPRPATPPPPPNHHRPRYVIVPVAVRCWVCCLGNPWAGGQQLTFATADFSSRVPCAFSESLIIFWKYEWKRQIFGRI